MVFLTKLLPLLLLVTISFANFKPKLVYLSYVNAPTKLYKNQIFAVDVEAIIAMDDFLGISSHFEPSDGVKVLNEANPWERSDTNRLKNRYYMKVLSTNAKLPNLHLAVKNIDDLIERDTLVSEPLKISSIITTSENFSNLLTESLIIKRHKVNRYDNDTNIIVIEMDSLFGNLEDFSISGLIKQGMESITFNPPTTKAFYYAVIPNNISEFSFSYFDIKSEKFKKVNLHIELDEDKVSTQSDLVPVESSYDIYKISILILLTLISAYLFITKWKYIYLVVAILSLGITLYIALPKEELVLKTDTSIYLLPTKNSTIFFVTKFPLTASKLKSQGEYIKIMFQNEKIGWIKKDDIKN
jgi:hypothetical protein